jgi:hypothetical protein
VAGDNCSTKTRQAGGANEQSMYSVMPMAKSHLKTKCAVSLRFDVGGNTKGGSIIVPLTSCLTVLESAVYN